MSEYLRSIELDPTLAYPHANLGYVHRVLGNFDEAIAEYEIARTLDRTNHGHARYVSGIGDVYRKQRNYDRAIESYNQASELDPQYASSHRGLGSTYEALGDYQAAKEEYSKAISLNPTNAAHYAGLISVLHKLDRQPEANEQLEIVRKKVADRNYYIRACFEALCGNSNLALPLLESALQTRQTSIAWVRGDPDWDSLRSDPRFIALVGAADNSPSADTSG